jgi:hypothetical protein
LPSTAPRDSARIQIDSKMERGAVRAGEDELGNRLIDDLDRAPDLTAFPETVFSVLLVAIFHASFDGAINQLAHDIVTASNTARFLIFSAVIVLAATIVIMVTKGQLGPAKAATATELGPTVDRA